MNLPNIKYTGEYAKFVENREDSLECIQFYKGPEYFEDIQAYTTFVKSVEKLVRTSLEYKAFIAYVKNTIGINFCQVSSNILESEHVDIEMHHGPIFTLFDYASIILNKYIDNKIPVTTFQVADDLLDEHFAMRVQVVMLTKTNHEAVGNRDIFLNLKQGLGNISEFIKLYSPYITDDQKYRIHRYIAMCKENDSFDNGVLDYITIEKMIPM